MSPVVGFYYWLRKGKLDRGVKLEKISVEIIAVDISVASGYCAGESEAHMETVRDLRETFEDTVKCLEDVLDHIALGTSCNLCPQFRKYIADVIHNAKDEMGKNPLFSDGSEKLQQQSAN